MVTQNKIQFLSLTNDGLNWKEVSADGFLTESNNKLLAPVNTPNEGDVLIWTGGRSRWMSLQEALRRYGGDPVKKGKIAEDAVTPSFIADDAITS